VLSGMVAEDDLFVLGIEAEHRLSHSPHVWSILRIAGGGGRR
jgi:hypothetical protein